MALVKYNNNSISAVTSAASIPSSALTLIKTLTASSSATLSFVDGSSDVVLDSTYPIYLFKFINIHPETDARAFTVNFRDGGSSYDATKTTTWFQTYHGENGASGSIGYETGYDLAQSTSDQQLIYQVGNGNDECCSGELWLFSPSSTTFVKHFFGKCSSYYYSNANITGNYAGYCNVTAAIDGVQFKMDSGNIDAGTIKLYGIKDS
tara:strand:+ start:202 stop:822 length:621 start_codon:yes stop_codon:yes gene_type:complete